MITELRTVLALIALFMLLLVILVITRYYDSWLWYGTANFIGGAIYAGWIDKHE